MVSAPVIRLAFCCWSQDIRAVSAAYRKGRYSDCVKVKEATKLLPFTSNTPPPHFRFPHAHEKRKLTATFRYRLIFSKCCVLLFCTFIQTLFDSLPREDSNSRVDTGDKYLGGGKNIQLFLLHTFETLLHKI